MNKRNIIFGVVGVVVIIGLLVALNCWEDKNAKPELDGEATGLPQDVKNLSFTIAGEAVVLENGVAKKQSTPGSASERVVRYFGNEVEQDIDGDGDLDKVFLVTDETGGSGTFFYVVGAIKEEVGYRGSQAMFLGDRIAPQTSEMGENKMVIVNYADRAPGEPMTEEPSVGKSIWLKFDTETNSFGEVVQNFEGEVATNAPEKINLIRISEPALGEEVGSPITVSGVARGYWFFEGSFPLMVVNWNGLIIGEGYATADGEWMTEEFVPFTGTLEYELPADSPYTRGAIIFRKDNPSGLPEHDDAVEIPVDLRK